MKKTLLVLGCAAAMFAGCSNDETVEVAEKQAIDFTSFVDKSTRATAEDVTISNIGEIYVYGWRDNDVLFNAQKVTVSAEGAGSYSPVKYWEPSHTYTFEAVKPNSGAVSFAPAKTGGTITLTNDAKTDVVYNGIVTNTTPAVITTKPAVVDFTLKHLLSRVKFTFKNVLEGAENKITIKNVKITNAYKSGTVTPVTSTTWTATDNTLNVSFEPSSTDALTNLVPNATGDTEHMYLIPTTAEYTVTFDFELDQNGVKSNYSRTATIPSMTMESGKSYNFVAEVGLYPIVFTVGVSDWGTFTTPSTGITVQ